MDEAGPLSTTLHGTAPLADPLHETGPLATLYTRPNPPGPAARKRAAFALPGVQICARVSAGPEGANASVQEALDRLS